MENPLSLQVCVETCHRLRPKGKITQTQTPFFSLMEIFHRLLGLSIEPQYFFDPDQNVSLALSIENCQVAKVCFECLFTFMTWTDPDLNI